MLNSLFQTSANKSNGLVFCAVCLCSSIGRRSFRHRTMHAMELVLRRDATSHQLSLMVLFRISCIWKKSVPMARLLQWEHYVLLGALGCLARDTDTEKLLAMAGSANIFVSGFLAKAVVKLQNLFCVVWARCACNTAYAVTIYHWSFFSWAASDEFNIISEARADWIMIYILWALFSISFKTNSPQ